MAGLFSTQQNAFDLLIKQKHNKARLFLFFRAVIRLPKNHDMYLRDCAAGGKEKGLPLMIFQIILRQPLLRYFLRKDLQSVH